MKRAGLVALVVALTLTAQGCMLLGLARSVGIGGKGDGLQKPKEPVRVKSVSLVMSENANQQWPVRVELVRVRDEALAEVLLRMEARDWFQAAGQGFRQANPSELYNEWEVVPGTNIGPFKVRKRGRFAGILFCGTRTPEPPLRLKRSGNLMIYIDDAGCSVTNRDGASRGGWLRR